MSHDHAHDAHDHHHGSDLSPIEARGVEYREIARSIADRDTLDGFLKNYRERYPSESPGATVPATQQQSDTPTGATPRQG